MHDLDTRLERLAAEATRDAIPPEPETIARRGRRRRRRQLTGSALLVAAVAAAALVLPARLSGRPGGDPPVPAAGSTGVGAEALIGFWAGKTDASVFLENGIAPEERAAVLHRMQALDVVDDVYYESRQDAFARFRYLYRDQPGMLQNTDPAALPESFRVRLDAPEHFKRLWLALCRERCIDGVQRVIEDRELLKPVVAGERWLARSDVTILLPEGTSVARRDAVRARLEAIDGVQEVAYESPAEAFARLPEKLRQRSGPAPTIGPESMLASFHVTLAEPARVGEFHKAFCGSRRTGDCSHGIVVEHPRR